MLIILGLVASAVATADVLPGETAEVKALLASTKVTTTFRYCIEGTLTCRELNLLEDKTSGKPVRSFYDTFVSAQRAVGATSYFIENSNGTFHLLLDDVLDGQVGITKVFPENSQLVLNFNRQGFPKINHAHAVRVGTTRWLDLTTTFSSTRVVMEGTEYDTADPKYANPVKIVYLRVR